MTPLFATVLLDPPTALIFGSALGLVSGKLIRRNPEAELKTTAVLAGAWSAWYGVCVGWFFFARPDWMFVYLLDTQTVPLVPAFLVFMVLLVVHGVFGALGAGILMQQQRKALAAFLAAGAVLTIGFFFAISANAYVHLGTFEQYTNGVAPALETDGTMKLAMNLSGAGSGLAAALMLFLRFKKARTL